MPTNKSSNKRGPVQAWTREKKKSSPALSAARRPATDSFLPSHFFLFHLFFFRHGCYGSSLARVSDYRLRELRLFLPAPKSKLRFCTLPALLFFFGASCEIFPSCPCPEGRIVCGLRAETMDRNFELDAAPPATATESRISTSTRTEATSWALCARRRAS